MEKFLKSKFLFCIIFLLILISLPIFASSVSVVYIREILLAVLFIFVALVLIISIYALSNSIKDRIMIKKQINSITIGNYEFSKNTIKKSQKETRFLFETNKKSAVPLKLQENLPLKGQTTPLH